MAINHGKIECIMISDLVDMIKELEAEVNFQWEMVKEYTVEGNMDSVNMDLIKYHTGRMDEARDIVAFIKEHFEI